MKLKELIDKILKEERSAKDLLGFDVQLGENEGNIPHFHLDNGEIGNKKKKTAIRLDMPFYFLHSDKNYILNSKEKKQLILWLADKPIYKKGNSENEIIPKSNWENLKTIWNQYYPNNKITCGMPNYSLLEKDYKTFRDI